MKTKFWRSVLRVLALLLLCFALIPSQVQAAEVASGTCGYMINWVLDDAGTLTISGDGDMAGYGSESDVPWYAYKDAIKRVVVEEGVTEIGHYAFMNCTELTEVTIPNSLTYIGGAAFNGCTSLNRVNISDIAAWCEIRYQSYASNPVQFAGNLYLNGELVTDLVIPDSVSKLNSLAFFRCTSLTSVTIPSSVTSIAMEAFCECSGLTSVTIGDGVSVGEAATTIGERAFYNCSALTSVVIGDSVISIGDSAFSDCTGLNSMTIGGGLTDIGVVAFYNCSSLTDVYITNPSAWCKISFGNHYSNPRYYADTLHIVDAEGNEVKEIVLDDSLTEIPENAFKGCIGMTGITIPKGVTGIGNYAFSDCTGLTSITIPDGITNIGEGVFCNCTSLTSVTIPDSITSIGEIAFSLCSSLTDISIPESVTSIGESAFSGCSSLTSITIPDSVPCVGYATFTGCTNLANVIIGAGVSEIGALAFEDCTSLTTITIGGSVTSIGWCAFNNCTELSDVYTTDIVGWQKVSFGDEKADPMNYASNLHILDGEGNVVTKVVVPGSFTEIPERLFERCTDLTDVIIEDGVTSIGYGVFSGCTALTSISIPDSVTIIDGYAFEGCIGLTGVTIPDSVTSIGDDVFSCCTGLTSITIPDSVTFIGDYVFYGCTGLTDVNIGNGDSIIGHGVFSGCTGLTGITIPEGVTTIGTRAFQNCTSLVSITIPDSITDIFDNAFDGCTNLKHVLYTGSESQWNEINFYYENDAFTGFTLLPRHYDCTGDEINVVERCDYQLISCEVCHEELERLPIVSGKEHSYTTQVKTPTCTEDGYTTYTCACGDSYVADEKTALGHKWVNGTCAQCGENESGPSNPFNDVAEGAFYYDSVLWAVGKGVTSGISPTQFAPEQTCTRGQVVTFLWRSMGEPKAKNRTNPFEDVKEGAYYYEAVLWAVENGVTAGTSEKTFSPDAPCTRSQVVTFLWRTMGEPADRIDENPFRDAYHSTFYFDAMLWAVKQGITTGTSATTFSPDNPCTRGQVVTFLYRTLH